MKEIHVKFSAIEDDGWALVPGPKRVSGSVSTSNVRNIAEYSARSVEEHLRNLENLDVTHEAKYGVECWRAELKSVNGCLSMRMTLHDDDEFGGLCIFGECERTLIYTLWSHLRKRFPAIWLFEPDLYLHSPDTAFAGNIVSQQFQHGG